MTIETELMQIKGSQEFLKAEDVVDWAEAHPKSELWKQFEWHDDVAAQQYRIWQARRIIALHITTEDGVRSMISLSIDRGLPGGGYRGLNDILADKTLHEIMLDDALAELERVRNKYAQLKALQPIWAAKAKVTAARDKKRKGRRKGGGEARLSVA